MWDTELVVHAWAVEYTPRWLVWRYQSRGSETKSYTKCDPAEATGWPRRDMKITRRYDLYKG